MGIKLKKFRIGKLKTNNEDSFEDKTEVIKNGNDNLKNNNRGNNKLIINFTAFISILIMAFGIMLCYPKIKEISNNEDRTPYEDYNLLRNIDNCTLVLYKDIVEKQSGSEKSLEEIYINSYTDYNTDENVTSNPAEGKNERRDRYEENVLNSLQSRVYNVQLTLNYDFKNLEYAALDNDGNIIVNRGMDNINTVLSQGVAGTGSLKDIYGFYVVINYDSNGYPQIKDYYGTNFNYIRNTFGHRNIDSQFSSNYAGYRINYNSIKDTTIVYGIPKELKYDDEISSIVNERSNNYVSKDVILIFGLIAGFIVLFAGLVIPYKTEIRIAGFKSISKIPFEIACIFYGILSVILIASAIGITTVTISGKAIDVLEYLRIRGIFDNVLIYLCNLALWMVIIYFVLSGMTYLKSIFHFGFKNYVKDRVLIVRCFRYVAKKVEDGLDYLSHIDLSDRSNKIIIKVLIINFIVLSGISIIWFFGIFAAAVYNGILFVLIRKYYDRIRDNYSNLLNVTNKIADGNLDVEISEDLGIFNPFKDELKKIQSGFKKAVNEEVKSQKMKTELISNVSHDLKTPLTSIITYIDLLKKNDITEEERQSYIDTIDKKSQRLKFLIEDLFEVSKATSGNINLNPVNVDIIELIKQIEIELSDKFDNAKVKVKNNFPDKKVILKLDSQKTFRVFENLLNNAAKYSMEGSRVYVDMIESDENVVIEIKNMSAVEIDYKAEEIIERFQRGDKSRNTEGSGLGLDIAKSFVEAQGGSFRIELDGDLFKAVVVFIKNN